MVGPTRPQIVLFGSSIVEYGFSENGWAADLAHNYARKADIFMRGYAGWNSRQARQVVDRVFPKDDPIKPTLVIVYFGGNDSALPNPDGPSPHVPPEEYVSNMKSIAQHLQSLSKNIRLLFLTAPPVNEEQAEENFGHAGRTNEQGRIYANLCLTLCKDMNINAIDLFEVIQRRDDWLTTSFTDGIHFTPLASSIVAEEIHSVIFQADWTPSLSWRMLPTEFENVIVPTNAVG